MSGSYIFCAEYYNNFDDEYYHNTNVHEHYNNYDSDNISDNNDDNIIESPSNQKDLYETDQVIIYYTFY